MMTYEDLEVYVRVAEAGYERTPTNLNIDVPGSSLGTLTPVSGVADFNVNGFNATTLYSASTDTIVIGVGGTEQQGSDWLYGNIPLITGLEIPQQNALTAYTNAVLTGYQNQFGTSTLPQNVVFVGHSLGGALATQANLDFAANATYSGVQFSSVGLNAPGLQLDTNSDSVTYVFTDPRYWDIPSEGTHKLNSPVSDNIFYLLDEDQTSASGIFASGHGLGTFVAGIQNQENSQLVSTSEFASILANDLVALRDQFIIDIQGAGNASEDASIRLQFSLAVNTIIEFYGTFPGVRVDLILEEYNIVPECFMAGTKINVLCEDFAQSVGPWKVDNFLQTMPIEKIRVGDWVVSYDNKGDLVPGRVTKTFKKQVKIVLNWFGTRVTPGHVYYRADSERSSKFETLIDILRDDGIVQKQDGSLVRASTNVPVSDVGDKFVKAFTAVPGKDDEISRLEEGRIRLGTRFIVGEGEQRKHWAVIDLIEHAGGTVGEDEMIHIPGQPPMAFHWEFGETLPKPEDFVLQASGTTLQEIYQANEWDDQRPHMPVPVASNGNVVQPLSGEAFRQTPRNEPLVFSSNIGASSNQKKH